MHFGTSAYVGLGISLEQTERHLAEAQAAGIDMLFTSMQLPESDIKALHSDMPKLTKLAHSYGMKVDADVAPRTMERFGIGRMDVRAFREFGLDVIRLDYGYSLEETVELTHNTQGLTVELNATIPADKQKENLEALKRAGAKMDRLYMGSSTRCRLTSSLLMTPVEGEVMAVIMPTTTIVETKWGA